jgi:hypothetical protein
VALVILHTSMTVQIFNNFVLNGFSRHFLSALPQDVGQHIPDAY